MSIHKTVIFEEDNDDHNSMLNLIGRSSIIVS